MPTASRAWAPATEAGKCTADFGLSGLGNVAHKQRVAIPTISARPPEELLP